MQSKPIPPDQLLQIQTVFKQYLLEGETNIEACIVGKTKEECETRLGIYQNAYYLRLIDSLKQDYSALLTLLGEDQFTELALAYIRTFPSVNPSLRHFGNALPKFIQDSTYFRDRSHIAEVARLQWALIDAFDAPDQQTIGQETMARIPPDEWPQLVVKFHASVQTLSFRFNSVEIYSALKSNAENPKPVQMSQPANVLIWRQALISRYRTLEVDEGKLLEAALQGESFSNLCELIANDSDDPQASALRVVSLLKHWLQDGLLIAAESVC